MYQTQRQHRPPKNTALQLHISKYSSYVDTTNFSTVKYIHIKKQRRAKIYEVLRGQISIAKDKYISEKLIQLGSFDLFSKSD